MVHKLQNEIKKLTIELIKAKEQQEDHIGHLRALERALEKMERQKGQQQAAQVRLPLSGPEPTPSSCPETHGVGCSERSGARLPAHTRLSGNRWNPWAYVCTKAASSSSSRVRARWSACVLRARFEGLSLSRFRVAVTKACDAPKQQGMLGCDALAVLYGTRQT